MRSWTAKSLFLDLDRPVSRREYALVGFALLALKVLGDVLIVRIATGQPWTALDSLLPFSLSRLQRLSEWNYTLLLSVALWSLPFLWIGATFTLRRVIDAGLAPGCALLFFVPVMNGLWMLALCVFPSAPPREQEPGARAPPQASAIWPVCAGALAGLPALVVGVALVHEHGWTLFAGTPFLMGTIGGLLSTLRGQRASIAIVQVPTLSLLVALGALLLFALEGVICLAMVFPFAWVLAVAGGAAGCTVARLGLPSAVPALVAGLGLPGLAGVEHALARPLRFAVVTAIEVDAPPERVWEHVIAFPPLPPPRELLFRTGIACPTGASIAGRGVGALRRCEFTTGTFVEPITAWNEPHRLAFDVSEQPDPLRELHPWADVHPPHLTSGWRSLRGEFLLEPLPGGRTRLVGTTWCELGYAPAAYWRPWAEWIVHTIHGRVLRHVAALAEAQ